MLISEDHHKSEMDRIIEDLERMRRFSGPPNAFWPEFLEGSAHLAGAKFALLMVLGEDEAAWRHFCVWPPAGHRSMRTPDIKARIEGIADESMHQGYAWENTESKESSSDADGIVLGVRLDIEEDKRAGVGVFFLDNGAAPSLEEIATRLKLVADIPAVYQMGRVVNQARNDVVQFADALDLMVLLNEKKRFLAAAMTFCNELASRYGCERASLGWLKGRYVRVQAISHMERFEKKMDAVQILEAAMEEAFDQDEEVVCPRPEGSTAVSRDHEAFSKDQGAPYMVSLPIRVDDTPVGVVTCERSGEPFSEDDVRGLRVLCDQAGRRLGDLKRYDRWFGAKIASGIRSALAKIFGIEHTFAKLLSVIVAAALAFIIFGQWNYRVEAPFILSTDDVAFLPAPFDGYIYNVKVKVGDQIEKGTPLLSLDTRELLLEESTAIANQKRYSREAEKARAKNALADMKIARALEDQAKARLKLVRYHLNNALLKAPFAGIVVEGDLEELLGAPVRKGDILFKVARIEQVFAELKVDETDIHEVGPRATGEIAFVSRPDLKFPIQIERIDPVAIAEEEGNVFLVRSGVYGRGQGLVEARHERRVKDQRGKTKCPLDSNPSDH